MRSTPSTNFEASWRQFERWFSARGWTPWDFQREAWTAYLNEESGLIHVPTGSGKTYSALMGPLIRMLENRDVENRRGVQLLYLTPLRALSRDILLSIRRPIEELSLPFRAEARTGDTPSHVRTRQRKDPPEILVTTPESLELILSSPDSVAAFSALHSIIVDEWHELLGNKRGILLELSLARLRRLKPKLQSWGLSATIADLSDAAQALVGAGRPYTLISAAIDRPVIVESALPENGAMLPLSGHLGTRRAADLISKLNPDETTLLFTNTRSQAELWFAALSEALPGWPLGLHHGSLDRAERERVETGVRERTIRLVVATSSLDLGIDFPTVDHVVQIGSPKGIGRTIQRAGRSRHRMGAASTITIVPTHAAELYEVVALRKGIQERKVEPRLAISEPIDVLIQHLVTLSIADALSLPELFHEVRATVAYSRLTWERFEWAVRFVTTGGEALTRYSNFRRVERHGETIRMTNRRLMQLHRLNIGTIASESSVTVRLARGKVLGTIDEGSIARIRPGDCFSFAGRLLRLVTLRDLVATVRPAHSASGSVIVWSGARLPISEMMGSAIRSVMAEGPGAYATESERRLFDILSAEVRLPDENELLIERVKTRDGVHTFIYPFEGRLVHEGVAALLAYRLSRETPLSFATSSNDYGFELLSPQEWDLHLLEDAKLWSSDALEHDIAASVELSELAKRRFRAIAQIAGLTPVKFPGRMKSNRQLTASSGLIHDVLIEYDPDNLLLAQARREVIEELFERSRLLRCLDRIAHGRRRISLRQRPTWLAFPLIIERVQSTISSERLIDRIQRMQREWQLSP